MTLPDEKLLKTYAAFAVRRGVNVQKDQTLLINCPVDCAWFARLCAEEAFAAGAKDVVVHYNDEKLARMKVENASEETLADVKPWVLASYMDYVTSPGGACALNIVARNPEIYKGLPEQKVDTANKAQRGALRPYREYTMGDKIQWSIVALPSPAWAKKVFPDLAEDKAMEALWEAILDVTRMKEADPFAAWDKHIASMKAHADYLNAERFPSYHLKSKKGTDLVVGMADDYQWVVANSKTPQGYTFIPNVPTEELFSAPHKDKVNGTVYGTKPYVYNGNIMNNFKVTFKDGEVVDYDAETGKELLKSLLSTDPNAKRLGELALVAVSSPIYKKNILFYNTLFDENASCHIAFGAGYPGTIEGGAAMTREQLSAKGLNDSLVHDDVMVSDAGTDVYGVRADGSEVPLMQNGEWVI